MREISIPIGERSQLSAKEWGPDDGEPVIAIHGWLDNAASFDVLAPMLNGIRIVAVDVRGHGLSSHKESCEGYNLFSVIRDIYAVADYLKWDTFSLLGHSMGGTVATLAAGTIPERVKRIAALAVFCPIEVPEDSAAQLLADSITHQPLLKLKPVREYNDIDQMVASRIKRSPFKISHEAASLLVQRGYKKTANGKYTWNTDIKHQLPFGVRLTKGQVAGFLSGISAEFCFVQAENLLFPEDLVKNRLDLIKNSEIYDIGGEHHFHMENEAPVIAEILRRFFTR